MSRLAFAVLQDADWVISGIDVLDWVAGQQAAHAGRRAIIPHGGARRAFLGAVGTALGQ